MIITLYQKITEKLQAVQEQLTQAGILQPITVDFYYGQPLNPEAFEITFPAVLIDHTIDWENETLLVQAHVVYQYTVSGNNPVPDITAGMQYVKLLNIVRYALNGLKSDNLGYLIPTTEQKAVTNFFHYHIISFKATITGGIPGENELVEVDGITGVITNRQLLQKAPAPPNIDIF
jgi:hypothetical protein